MTLEQLKKQLINEFMLVDINGKYIPLKKLPCWTCEWRYSTHCPHCNWNKKGKYKVY